MEKSFDGIFTNELRDIEGELKTRMEQYPETAERIKGQIQIMEEFGVAPDIMH